MDKGNSFEAFLATQSPHIDLPWFVFDMVLAFLLTYLLARVYVLAGHSLSNRMLFARNLVIMGMTTMLIISIVKSSLALSLGLVGALSIVRFRTPIKEPEELAYLFISIAIGLGMGAGQRVIVPVGFLLILAVIWFRKKPSQILDNQVMLLGLSAKGDVEAILEKSTSILKQHAAGAQLRRLDESAEQILCDFEVEFDDLSALEQTKQALLSLDSSVQVSLVDNKPF